MTESLERADEMNLYAYDAYLLRCAAKYRLPLLVRKIPRQMLRSFFSGRTVVALSLIALQHPPFKIERQVSTFRWLGDNSQDLKWEFND